MEIKDYFLVLGPLIGVVLGGLISVGSKWIELRHQWKLERRRSKLQKFEDLYFELESLQAQAAKVNELMHQIRSDIKDPLERMSKYTEIEFQFSELLTRACANFRLQLTPLLADSAGLIAAQQKYFAAALAYLSDDRIGPVDRQIMDPFSVLLKRMRLMQLRAARAIAEIEAYGYFDPLRGKGKSAIGTAKDAIDKS